MGQVTKRELNQRTAAVLDMVSDSADVVVTEHGKPRWRIGAFREEKSPLEWMEREGTYTPAVLEPEPWPERPVGPKLTDADVDSLLAETKGEH